MTELTTGLMLQKQTFESLTYGLSDTKIEGFVDGLEALKQANKKRLSTEQYEYPIYSFGYGIHWKQLIGEEQPYVRAELKRMVQETLLQDDRNKEVDGFQFEFSGDTCRCSFSVTSIYGNYTEELEVTV